MKMGAAIASPSTYTLSVSVCSRGQLFQKLEGLLENKPNTYTKQSLCQILLCGEKPHLPEKYVHNKHIFYAVQTFLCKTKRLFYNEQNKPNIHNNVAPPEWISIFTYLSTFAHFLPIFYLFNFSLFSDTLTRMCASYIVQWAMMIVWTLPRYLPWRGCWPWTYEWMWACLSFVFVSVCIVFVSVCICLCLCPVPFLTSSCFMSIFILSFVTAMYLLFCQLPTLGSLLLQKNLNCQRL